MESILYCTSCHPDNPSKLPASTDDSEPTSEQGQDNVEIVNQDEMTESQKETARLLEKCRNRNKGGRPKGTTLVQLVVDKLNKKKATNWVCMEYCRLLDEAEAKRINVKPDTRERLVKEAKEKFKIRKDFTVTRQKIDMRRKAKKLEVWHPGAPSPLLLFEVML